LITKAPKTSRNQNKERVRRRTGGASVETNLDSAMYVPVETSLFLNKFVVWKLAA